MSRCVSETMQILSDWDFGKRRIPMPQFSLTFLISRVVRMPSTLQIKSFGQWQNIDYAVPVDQRQVQCLWLETSVAMKLFHTRRERSWDNDKICFRLFSYLFWNLQVSSINLNLESLKTHIYIYIRLFC